MENVPGPPFLHIIGPSKLKLPHIVETDKNLGGKSKPPMKTDSTQTYSIKQENNIDSTQHEKNILSFIIVVGGLAWYLFR